LKIYIIRAIRRHKRNGIEFPVGNLAATYTIPNGFTISWATNAPVVVEASMDLSKPIWTPIATNTLSADGTSSFNDPQWTNYPARFYRLRSP
jgi:hypothetical protein